jgi:nuclear transport factor 2 (NTF2) superfamily protein
MNRPPLPPFTDETATQKARLAEDAWNTRDPARVLAALAGLEKFRQPKQLDCYGPTFPEVDTLVRAIA